MKYPFKGYFFQGTLQIERRCSASVTALLRSVLLMQDSCRHSKPAFWLSWLKEGIWRKSVLSHLASSLCLYLKCVIWFSRSTRSRSLISSNRSFSSTVTVPIPSGLKEKCHEWLRLHLTTDPRKSSAQQSTCCRLGHRCHQPLDPGQSKLRRSSHSSTTAKVSESKKAKNTPSQNDNLYMDTPSPYPHVFFFLWQKSLKNTRKTRILLHIGIQQGAQRQLSQRDWAHCWQNADLISAEKFSR